MTHVKRFAPALALVALLWGVAPARAQGSFYQEVPKDDRIYVFNQMKVYEEWLKTGEMGKSITRVGVGPNGETIVFDSNEAIHLYNFKHGLPGEVLLEPEVKKPTMNISWKDGKTTFEFDKAQINISNRVQVRYTHDEPGDPNNHESKGSFRIRRGRTKVDGWIYSKDLTYGLEMDWADSGNILLEAGLNYDVSHGRKLFQIQGGQFKTPVSRQFLTSSTALQFVDRSIVTAEFTKEYDIGMQLWGQTPGGKLEWRGGLFNGADRNKTANDNDKFEFDGRVTWNVLGDVKYSESDFESTDKPLLAVAVKYYNNNMQGATAGDDLARQVYGADLSFKFKGLSVLGEFYQRKSQPEVSIDFDSTGYYAQVGYFIYKRHVEVALRHAMIDPRDNTVDSAGLQVATIANDHRIERGVAVNWFMNKHSLKLQTDYIQVEDELRDRTDDQARLQMQIMF
ncbi:MAG TPA: porin [Candidatus Polarisedimenticolia bacterium]|nr:porin [Candidatus Polarisedimenticolia bacterium]